MNETAKQLKGRAPKIFEALYLSCLFFITFEIAVPLPVSIYKGLYLALFFVLGIRVLLLREGFSLLLPDMLRTRAVLLPVILLAGYLLWDAVGLLYSPDAAYGAKKYYVILPMLLLCVPTVCYARSETRLDLIYRTLALSGAAVMLFSLVNYFVYEWIELPYIRRLSMLADYNRYAENLFIGMVLAGYGTARSKLPLAKRTAVMFALLAFFACAITLSGSRRTYLLMFPAIALLLLYRFFCIARYSATERKAILRLCAGGLLCLFALCVVLAAKTGFESYSDEKYRQQLIDGGNVGEESNVDTVIDSIASGGILDKRAAIWHAAVKDALDYDFLDILVGRGSGYDSYLYDHTDDPRLTELYAGLEPKSKNWMNPHNFLIADFLNGGAVRVGLSLALAASVGASLWAVIIRRPGRALAPLTAIALVYFNAFISGRYGFVYDKFYYILLMCVIAEHALAVSARPEAKR